MQPAIQRPSRQAPGFLPLPLPRLGSNGWKTPTSASTAASSPWDDGIYNPFADMTPTIRPPLQPLRLSLLQHREDSASSTTVNPPESPRPLSPFSSRRPYRTEGSALGIIVPPGTPPADALPRWLVDGRSSKQRSLLSDTHTPSRGAATYSSPEPTFHSGSPAISGWQGEYRPLVRTPEPLVEGQARTPYGYSRDSFPFDIGVVSGERVDVPAPPKPRPRPLPLPRCSSDDLNDRGDRRLFRVNAWGERNSPIDASSGLFSLMQSQSRGEDRSQSRPRYLPPSRLASSSTDSPRMASPLPN
ncbi:hypothetical protein CTheo_1896 [Ceratobasidium theobromae]|uniref:Uncharacterized protein n=1 Tax=Ceratobasidium theobromae TaxID=1582974 RepID=A0A5N5QSY3_9AGAM|nr:hypothetical protein CTheo_1896 [Ceratobasidium theobromae]